MRWGWLSIETGETDWYPTFRSWLKAIPSYRREKRAIRRAQRDKATAHSDDSKGASDGR